MTNISNTAASLGAGDVVMTLGPWVSAGVYVLASVFGVYLAIAYRKSFHNITRAKPAPGTVQSNVSLESAPPSFSRITGIVGLAYLTAFCWGLGLYALVRVWAKPADVSEAVKGSGDFIMALSALFAPYAFNQLSQIFGGKSGQAGSGESATRTPTVTRDRNQMLKDIEPDISAIPT